jgi:cold shock CspA family protein
MCVDPATISVISMVASGVGTAMSVMGQMQQAEAAQAQMNYQAQVADNNRQIADWQAADAKTRGQIEEDNQRMQVQRMLGAQKAGLAGLDENAKVEYELETQRGKTSAVDLKVL